ARALGRASAGTAEGVPALTAALLADSTEEMHAAVARALGEVGEEARPAIPHLRALLQGKDGWMREVAEEALKKIEAGAPSDPAPPAKDAAAPNGALQDLEHPEVERQYLWEVEHHGNLLVKHGFGP